jgi:hypothetical protein
MQLKLSRVENQKARDLFKVPIVDWCHFVGGKSKANMLMKTLVDTFRDQLPKAVQKCPISGDISVHLSLISNKKFRMLPNGIYRVDVRVFNDFDSYVLFMQINIIFN